MGAAVALAAIAVACLALPGSALGGRLVATGHDADSHCSGSTAPASATSSWRRSATCVVARRPVPADAAARLLVRRQRRAGARERRRGRRHERGGLPDREPRRLQRDPAHDPRYSAIIVGSSIDALSTADSTALIARKNDIAAFFNQGGGIFALAGDSNGDDPADPYYQFVPIGIGGKQVASPFRLTPEGQALGFQDSVNGIGTNDDINCCPTHNSFQEPPAGSALKVAERDSSVPPAPETLFADGTISGGTIVNKPTFGKVVGLPSNSKCVSRRKFRIRIRQPGGIKIQTALVFVNGKKVRVLTRKVFSKKRKVAGVNLRGLPKGIFKVRIVVLTTEGTTLRGTRTYRTCTKKRKSKRPPTSSQVQRFYS